MQEFTRVYKCLLGITKVYKAFAGDYRIYKGLQEIRGVYKGSLWYTRDLHEHYGHYYEIAWRLYGGLT